MKKVLALVLAAIMVCTMAFAITIGDGSASVTTPEGTYAALAPGKVLSFTLADLLGDDDVPYTSDLKVAVDNIKVNVTYGVGADLVAKQGWVKVDTATETDTGDLNNNGTNTDIREMKDDYEYQIVLKNNDTKVADTKVKEFSITQVTCKAPNELINTYVFDGKTGNSAKYEKSFGYSAAELTVNSKATEGTDVSGVSENTVTTVLANGKTTTGFVSTALTGGTGSGITLDTEDTLKITFNVGDKFNKFDVSTATGKLADSTWAGKTKYVETNCVAKVANPYTLSGVVTLTNAKDSYKAYAVANDGTLTALATTIDDGVMTFTAPGAREIIVMKGSLVGATAATTPSTGATTNPETGANDVIGVAAALAVVALVSGAAISLKK